jgi:hypothetical protein
MNNKELFNEVRNLELPIGEYALFGSAPIGIRKLRQCHDIDIIVTDELWNKFESDWENGIAQNGSKFLKKGNIEIWKDWRPGKWDTNKLIGESEIIEGLPFVKMKYVLEWKRSIAREKDLKDIEIVEKYLKENEKTNK